VLLHIGRRRIRTQSDSVSFTSFTVLGLRKISPEALRLEVSVSTGVSRDERNPSQQRVPVDIVLEPGNAVG